MARSCAHADSGSSTTTSSTAMPAPASAPPSSGRRPSRSSTRGGRSASSASVTPPTTMPADADPALQLAEVLGPFELKRGEVRFRVHRGWIDQPASRPQQERCHPGGDGRSEDRQRQSHAPASHLPDTVEGTRMRIALLSDVHGNLPALRSVLADVDAAGVDEIWCLGDLVGYGAEPDGCVELARERCDLCLAGNHDLVVTGEIDIADFSAGAAAAARWTRETIGAEALEFLRGLAPADRRARARRLPRQPARPDLGVRALRTGRPRSAWR